MAGDCRFIPQRYVMSVFAAMGIFIMCGQRDNLSAGIAIGFRKLRENDSSNSTFNETVSDVVLEKVDWSDVILHMVMFAFIIGFLCGQIPTGFLSDKIGGKWVFFVGAASSTGLTLLMPIILDRSPYILVFTSRIVLGICQSVTYTSTSSLMAHWIPPTERSTIGGFVYGIYPLATTARRIASDSLRLKSENWAIPLYFWGSCGLLWCGLYIPFVYSYPERHPGISQEEKDFLAGKVASQATFTTPSRQIFKNYGIWTLVIGHIGQNYALYSMTGTLPWYLMYSLKMSENGMNMLVTLSFLGAWFTCIVSGIIVDYGVSRRGWSLKWCRRIVVFFSINIPSICLCFMYYFRHNAGVAICMFSLACILMGPFFSSFLINHMDISLYFAGILQGIVICLGDLSGITVAFIIKLSTLRVIGRWWEIDSWVLIALCLVTSTHYLLKAKADRADWDFPPDEQAKDEKEKK